MSVSLCNVLLSYYENMKCVSSMSRRRRAGGPLLPDLVWENRLASLMHGVCYIGVATV